MLQISMTVTYSNFYMPDMTLPSLQSGYSKYFLNCKRFGPYGWKPSNKWDAYDPSQNSAETSL